MIITPIFGRSQRSIEKNTVTGFAPITFAGGASDVYSTTTENSVQCVIPETAFVGAFYYLIANTPGSGKSWTITVMKNGVTTGLSLLISGAMLAASDTTTILNYAAGDLIDFQIVPSGTPASSGTIYSMILVGATNAVLLGTTSGIGSSQWDGNVTRTPKLTGAVADGPFSSTPNVKDGHPCPANGTLANFYFSISSAPTGNQSRAVKLVLNGATTQLVNFTSSNIAQSNTTNTFSVTTGDWLSYFTTVNNSPPGTWAAWGCSFIPNDTTGFVPFMMCHAPSNVNTANWSLLNYGFSSATEPGVGFQTFGNLTIKDMYFYCPNTTGGTSVYAVTFRLNTAATTLATTLSSNSTLTFDSVNTVNVTQNSVINYQGIPSGTPWSSGSKNCGFSVNMQWNGFNPFPTSVDKQIIFSARTNDPAIIFYDRTGDIPIIMSL